MYPLIVYMPSLESRIDVAPEINVATHLKKFHIRISIHFFINQGIAKMFHFFSSKVFQKLITIPQRLFRTLEYQQIFHVIN